MGGELRAGAIIDRGGGATLARCPKTGPAITSGLSKTHGYAIPTTQNVNSWGKRQRAVRLCEIATQITQ